MNKMKIKLLLFFIIGLIYSCSNDDENKIAGVDDYSGNYKLSYVTNSPTCTNGTSTSISTSSLNDLEISLNGRFKRKIYSLNSNNECTVSEILEGQITITGSYDYSNTLNWFPYGIVEYDNSESIDEIFIKPSVDGIHYELEIVPDGGPVQYKYYRTE
jgi:hypothetical protein